MVKGGRLLVDLVESGAFPREGASSGRRPMSNACSAIRALRCDARTEEKVATASTSVPAAVASDAPVDQSAVPADEGGAAAAATVTGCASTKRDYV